MIIMILAAMTVAVVNVAMDTDRIRSSARQVQSYLAGARDRAIFAQQPRGVRFLLEDNGILGNGAPDGANGPITITSMVFIGAPGVSSGTCRIADSQQPGTAFLIGQVLGQPTWAALRGRGLLVPGSRIRLINGSSKVWLDVHPRSFEDDPLFDPSPDPNPDDTPVGNGHLYLSRPHPDYLLGTQNAVARSHDLEYQLELAPAVLANQEPVLLAQGIAIDLEPVRGFGTPPFGRLPGIWFNPQTNSYERHIDVMFSPRGTVTGGVAAYGVVHFLLADVADIERRSGSVVGSTGTGSPAPAADVDGFIDGDVDGNGTIDETERNQGDKIIVSVFTRTGHISTNEIDPTDSTGDGFADDPFYFAERGEVAK